MCIKETEPLPEGTQRLYNLLSNILQLAHCQCGCRMSLYYWTRRRWPKWDKSE